MMASILREVVWLATLPLPEQRRIAIERRLRGRHELQRLKDADGVIVSFGKSGRTWLRVMVSRFYQVRHRFPAHLLIDFDNFHRRDRAVPRLLFTHDNYLKDFTGHHDTKEDYEGHRVVLLVRHPADVAVSQYFQWKYRMRTHKKKINDYPTGDQVPLFDFVMGEKAGLPKIIAFMNLWAQEAARFGDDLLVVRYEDMRSETAATLGRVLQFLGTPGEPDELADVVEFTSFENMKKMEQSRKFRLSGSRMVAKDEKNPQSFKVRRGKAGGYRSDFDAEQLARIDGIVDATLSPFFGYTTKSRETS